MKTSLNKFVLFSIMLFTSFVSIAQPSGRGGASGDDNEWLHFLIIGLVVGILIGFFGGKLLSNMKK